MAILRSTVEYNNFIRPICLPAARSNSQDIENKLGFVAGWGAFFLIVHFVQKFTFSSRKLSRKIVTKITVKVFNFPRFF